MMPKMPHVTWEFILEKEEDKKKLSSKKAINDFANEFCKKFELTLLSPRLVYKFKGIEPDENGITAFYILSESGIHIQTWPEYKYGFIDVFSCKHFDYREATRFVKDFFGEGNYKYDIKWRGLIISNNLSVPKSNSCAINKLSDISNKEILLDTKLLNKEMKRKEDLNKSLEAKNNLKAKQ